MEWGPLHTLELENFRNVESLKLAFHPRFNFFFGDNAQGKTSILEAIYFLSELKSFRNADASCLIRHQSPTARLFAQLSSEGLSYDLKVEITSDSKQVLLSGKTPRPYRRLRKMLPIVLFTPESVRLFRSAPSERRHYFDALFALLSEGTAGDQAEYARGLRQKQTLLEQIREGGRGELRSQLAVWTERLAEWGARIVQERFRSTSKLERFFRPYFQRLSGGQWEGQLVYEPYFKLLFEGQTLSQVQRILLEESFRREGEELERAQVLVGPHRDDWGLYLSGMRLKEEGSQGQHRISVAALKLAEVELISEHQMTPLALFDDLLSELDEIRNRTVLEQLGETHCQIFLTSVTPGGVSLEGLKGNTYPVRRGRVEGV
ncbi:MAG: DNA replication and repair protein RecF [bacterium]